MASESSANDFNNYNKLMVPKANFLVSETDSHRESNLVNTITEWLLSSVTMMVEWDGILLRCKTHEFSPTNPFAYDKLLHVNRSASQLVYLIARLTLCKSKPHHTNQRKLLASTWLLTDFEAVFSVSAHFWSTIR